MDTPADIESLALDACDREQIHRPGCIQPFGALIAAPLDLSTITVASGNTQEILGIAPGELLGMAPHDLFSMDMEHDLRNMLSMSTSHTQRERVGRMDIEGRTLEVFAHTNANKMAVVEFEPLDLFQNDAHSTPIDRMRLVLAQAAMQDDLEHFLQVCVHGVRSLTGYDRVKGYRFASNGDGEVVAESRDPQVESFLGLRYPAWDIPAQARDLMVRNPVRMLMDVQQSAVALIGQGCDPDTLDLSLAHLRGVSPVHIRYLQNMGVSATMSIGIVVNGTLWGMFACHHMSPIVLRSDTRIAIELFGQMVSLAIQQKLEMRISRARARAENAQRRILAETDTAIDLLNSFPDIGPILRSVVASDGLAVIRDGHVQVDGSVPDTQALLAIGDHAMVDEDRVEATDSLVVSGWAQGNDLKASAGCLKVQCAATAPLQILFFRDEKTRNIQWAGKPEKEIDRSGNDWRLSPRASFASYLEQQRNHAQPWDNDDIQAAKELQRLLLQITSRDERAQMLRHRDLITHQRQQDLMIAELNHRVKNILALIRSLSRQAKASSNSLESYAKALEHRISALAAAHDLAVSSTAQGVSLRTILETELKPYLVQDTMQVLLAGPVVGLRADAAPMIALVVHEILTNATKYGALSTDAGIVKASWSVSEDGLSFSWREIGGPSVTAPTRHGFGRSLIEKAIPYEFDGTSSLEFDPQGVTFSFTLPPDALVDMTDETPVEVVGTIGEIVKLATGKTALAVEDNIVLAMDMVEGLTRLGADAVETAATVEEAQRHIRLHKFDFAVLDINLRGTASFDVAKTLQERGVPFVFVTGYGSAMDVPDWLGHIPVLTKPVDEAKLSEALRKIMSAR